MDIKAGWIGDPKVKDIRTTKEESETRLTKMQKKYPILGYGITKNSPEKISVLVEKITPEIEAMFQKGIRGHDVTIIEVGHIVALNADRTSEYRPLFGGISVGHYQITAGTIGAMVYDKYTNQPLILSNAHVLANSDTPADDYAFKGDAIYQPGLYDDSGATLAGKLEKWVPLESGVTIDAATATPTVEVLNEIYGIPKITGIASPEVGMTIRKSGRTTGLTEGNILSVESTIDVDYGASGTIRFHDQFISTGMSSGGDSGSVCINDKNEVVGLLFAGSSSVTVYNNIEHVVDLLGIRFEPYGIEEGEDEIPVPQRLSQAELILIALGALALAITYSCVAR